MTKFISILTETPVHVGIGQANEAIDLPIARERSTHLPHVPGSGVKGAMKVWASDGALNKHVDRLFGKSAGDLGNDTGAGSILCGEMRLAFLPVRCLSGSYRYVTSPRILRRLQRDLTRAGVEDMSLDIPAPQKQSYCGDGDGFLALEEREFVRDDKADMTGLAAAIAQLFPERFSDPSSVAREIVILHDDDLAWFAQFGLPIATRNELDESKRVKRGHLWTEETLPSETLMWMVLSERQINRSKIEDFSDLDILVNEIKARPYLQVGGNETIGQGWLHMSELAQTGAGS